MQTTIGFQPVMGYSALHYIPQATLDQPRLALSTLYQFAVAQAVFRARGISQYLCYLTIRCPVRGYATVLYRTALPTLQLLYAPRQFKQSSNMTNSCPPPSSPVCTHWDYHVQVYIYIYIYIYVHRTICDYTPTYILLPGYKASRDKFTHSLRPRNTFPIFVSRSTLLDADTLCALPAFTQFRDCATHY